MKEKIIRTSLNLILLLSLICYSSFFVFEIVTLRSSLTYTVDFILDINADDNFLYEYGISYGSVSLSHKFDGELIKTKDIISLDNKTVLYVSKYDIIKKGQIIGIIEEQEIQSTVDGIILDINKGDFLDIIYQDFNKTYCSFELDSMYDDYFSTDISYSVFIDDIASNFKVVDIINDGNNITLITENFYYNNYMNDVNTYISLNILKKQNVLRIDNRYLTNQLSENKYLLKIYNPNVSKDKLYEVVIETGLQNEYYTEIISNNVFPYEGIIV